jgi:hypothetical protein
MEAEKMCTNYLIVLAQRMATQGSYGWCLKFKTPPSYGWLAEEEILQKVRWKRIGRKVGHASPNVAMGYAAIR